MNKRWSCSLLLTTLVCTVAGLHGQDPRPGGQDQMPQVVTPPKVKLLQKIEFPYLVRTVGPVDFRNTSRVDKLIRAGQLYLSLQDAIDLAIENNLDLQLQRFNPKFAETDVLRAKGGGLLRGVDFNIRSLPQGIGGPGSPLLTTVGGTSPITTVVSNSADLAPLIETTNSLTVNGVFPYATGTPIPQFDPFLTASFQGGHVTTLESNINTAGVNPLIANTLSGNVGYTQGFSTGTAISGVFQRDPDECQRADFPIQSIHYRLREHIRGATVHARFWNRQQPEIYPDCAERTEDFR